MGMQLVETVPTDRALRKQYLTAQAKYATVSGKRGGALPTVRVPSWQDVGKARGIAELVAERLAACEKDLGNLHTRVREDAAVGRDILPGYPVTITNGHWALAQANQASTDPKAPMLKAPAATMTLTADHWRAYSRVRTCRSERSHAVTWEFGEGGCVLKAGDLARLDCEASERVNGECQLTGTVILDDNYAWPLRGIPWTLGLTLNGKDPVAVFTYHEYAMVIMGMRLWSWRRPHRRRYSRVGAGRYTGA